MWEYLQAWLTQPSDVSKRLDEIKQDTLIISGEHDEIVPIEGSMKISTLISNSQFLRIPDGGHMPHEEQPDKFIFIVEEWLKDIESNTK